METHTTSGVWKELLSYFKAKTEVMVHDSNIEARLEPVTKRSKRVIDEDVKRLSNIIGADKFNSYYSAMLPDRPYYNVCDFNEALITLMRKDVNYQNYVHNEAERAWDNPPVYRIA